LGKKSCSQRDLIQMCHRVREFTCDNVEVYLNKLPYRETAKIFTYSDAKENVNKTYDMYDIYNNGNSTIIGDTKQSLYSRILIHNTLETMNKDVKYFVPLLIKLIVDKGSTYELDDDENNDNEDVVIEEIEIVDFNKENILNAENIDRSTFNRYIKCLTEDEATSDMKYAIEKYTYKTMWNIDGVDEEFLDKWYRKTYVLKNLRAITNGDNVDVNDLIDVDIHDEMNEIVTIDKHTDKRYLDYDKLKNRQRLNLIEDLIDKMGFDTGNIGRDNMLSREVFEANKLDCVENCALFTDEDTLERLFSVKVRNVKSIRAFMGFVNSLLKHYGLCVIAKINSIWDKKHKKKVNEYQYYIDYDDNIYRYI